MSELAIMLVFNLILLLAVICLLFFKNGKLVKGTIPFILIQIFPLILSAMYITSVPMNYVRQKVIGFLIATVVILTPIIKVKNFNLARIITVAISILLIMLVYFI